MSIVGHGYDFALRAPVAYILDDEGVCPVLVADLAANETARALGLALAVESPAPNRLERNTSNDRHDNTPPRQGDRNPGRLRHDVRPEPGSRRSRDRQPDRCGPDGHPGSASAMPSLTALLNTAGLPSVLPWLLFTAAGLVFAWGGSGLAAGVATWRGGRGRS